MGKVDLNSGIFTDLKLEQTFEDQNAIVIEPSHYYLLIHYFT